MSVHLLATENLPELGELELKKGTFGAVTSWPDNGERVLFGFER